METDSFTISIGNLGVKTTEKRGHTPEEIARWQHRRLFR